MNEKSSILEFCTGCGACKSAQCAQSFTKINGFDYPSDTNADFEKFASNVCFMSGTNYEGVKCDGIWGPVLKSYRGWSTDNSIRNQASSGGILTSLCIYLIETKIVDCILHTGADPLSPIGTKSYCSMSVESIINRCGSRSSSSSPLSEIYDYLATGKKYCFVGKPCDVATLKNLMKQDSRFSHSFPILLSFFCAGAPSENANKELLAKMGCKSQCVSLKYRGDGWPGYATAKDIDGNTHKIDYRSAWRDTLGRDIRKVCRFCIDGIGEFADVVCYDSWYMDSNNHPIFEEASGRNGLFCRTTLGEKIVNDASKKGYIYIEEYSEYKKELPCYQSYQHNRRATLISCLIALKLNKKNCPKFPLSYMIKLAKNCGLRTHYKRFIGTLKRIKTGKI